MKLNTEAIDDKVSERLPEITADRMAACKYGTDWLDDLSETDEGHKHLAYVSGLAHFGTGITQEDLNKVADYFIALYSQWTVRATNNDIDAIRQSVIDEESSNEQE